MDALNWADTSKRDLICNMFSNLQERDEPIFTSLFCCLSLLQWYNKNSNLFLFLIYQSELCMNIESTRLAFNFLCQLSYKLHLKCLTISYLWSLRWSCRLKAFPHISQEYGLSSVWVLSCINKLYDFVNWRLQNLHINCFFGLAEEELATCNTVASILLLVDVVEAGESDLQIRSVEQPIDSSEFFSNVVEFNRSVSSNGNSSSVIGFNCADVTEDVSRCSVI